ncbi:MAG: pyruvate, phosphate dikinase [Sporichthyaceae bacterium]
MTSVPLLARLDGTSELPREVLGNKAFGINAMRAHGIPVPPAFALTTEVCRAWQDNPDLALDTVWPEVVEGLSVLEHETGRTFGRGAHPLLVSVRSGAALSMPGMMDTLLNLGLDDAVVESLAAELSPEFAADTRARFEHLYTRIVLGAEGSVPPDPHGQLRAAIGAVFASWDSPRAQTYRAHHGLDAAAGTAVVVQAMVFGNLPQESGTGVMFTRNPMTGEAAPFGEWLPGGQGEDVVSGTHDCLPLAQLQIAMPAIAEQLLTAGRALECAATDIQDIEFTISAGTLWLLQTRVAKRSPQAAVRLAIALATEGLIDHRTAVGRVTPDQVRTLMLPALQPEDRLAAELLATGLAASPGVGSGIVVTDPDAAVDLADTEAAVVLVRETTSPDDVHGMIAAAAIVTEMGGATSHAAVVSRELGVPAVVGVGAGIAAALAGRTVTVDGSLGEVRDGALTLRAWSESDSPDLRRLAEWARQSAPIAVFTPAERPDLPVVTADTGGIGAALDNGLSEAACDRPLLAMLIAAESSRQAGE